MAPKEPSIQEFVATQNRLLELELRSEEEEDQKVRHAFEVGGRNSQKESEGTADGGNVIRRLDVEEVSVGLYGRTVVSFGHVIQKTSSANSDVDVDDDQGKTVPSATSSSRPVLQAHRLTVGDEVEILSKNGKGATRGKGNDGGKKSKGVGGVICAVDDFTISVALFGNNKSSSTKQQFAEKGGSRNQKKKNENDEEESYDENGDMLGGPPPYSLVPRSSAEVHQKMLAALDELERFGESHQTAGNIVAASFGLNCSRESLDISPSEKEVLEKELSLTRLDHSQKDAILTALRSSCPVSLIHGPPGTGKTTTVAELIRCATRFGWKILVTAPSNVAVDNVLDRLISMEKENDNKSARRKGNSKQNIKAVRLGHPARIHHKIQQYSLESLVQNSDGTDIVRDCRKELSSHLKTLSNPKARSMEKRAAYKEMKSLRKEIKSREEKVVGEILREANVVLATNVGAAGSVFNRMVDGKGEPIAFDLVVIDEAAQALEASCWISLLRGKRAVLAGDHKQLPPTIKSSVREVQLGLGRTMFERLMEKFDNYQGDQPKVSSKMLEVQYRMHEDIANWASHAMYGGKLISHESVKERKLLDLTGVNDKMKDETDSNLADVTLMLVDTTGCDLHEEVNDAGSRYNKGEADIVASHVNSLLSVGLRAEDIAVITPYNGQVELLRKTLLPDVPKLEIKSVDGFQGGEREAVVLSLVRSSDRGGKDGTGFLRDERRLNVAVTRAKRHCALICDCETVSQSTFIKDLVDWFEERGDVRSGVEYQPTSTTIKSDMPELPLATKESKQTKNSNIQSHKSQQQQQDDKKKRAENGVVQKPVPAPNDTTNTSQGEVQSEIPKKEESERMELLDKIKLFSESGKKGDELILNNLSSFDSVVACELAAQLGLGHHLVEGSNNTLALSIKGEKSRIQHLPSTLETRKVPETNFAALGDDTDDESLGNGDNSKNLLRELAKEREMRKLEQKIEVVAVTDSKKSKKKKKGKGQKLGGERKEIPTDDGMGDLDDMAFLDAQIEKVQNSHGRKIEASGKGYRSIINGVLLSKPTPPKKENTNSSASASLQAKIKSKEQNRKTKKKGKK